MEWDRQRLTPLWTGLGLRRIAFLAPLLCFASCSLIRVDDKAVDRLVDKLIPSLPTPVVEGPPAEKIIDWYDLLALGLMGAGGIAHRYYFHKKRAAMA